MDAAVGRVVAQLRSDAAQWANTVVIFSSDNGAPKAGSDVNHQVGKNPGWIARNYPFRGNKAQGWEGGARVPGFVYSPLMPKAARGTASQTACVCAR